MRVVTCLSGGPDSASMAAWGKENGDDQLAIFIDSGQLYRDQEYAAATAVADRLSLRLELVNVASFRDTLIGRVPPPYVAMGGDAEELARGGAFLPVALACCVALLTKADGVRVATIKEDVDSWPQITEFLGNYTANLTLLSAQNAKIQTPFANKTKAEVLALGASLNVPLDVTRTCQRTGLDHCGTCSRCQFRQQSFRDAGLEDRTVYAASG